MKALSKPISSPSRVENFPPPLMRFLSSNAGSRSRAKSRLSPMFYMRSKRNMEATQEPSSPKVTCIGQVRGSRSVEYKAKKAERAAENRRPCWWRLKKPLFCVKISSKLFQSQKKAFRRFFCKWALFFKSGYCKKIDAREDSFRVDSKEKSEEKTENIVEFHSKKCENEEIKRDVNFRDDSCYSSSPPENALILTRCRSAPYRSSSLGGRFLSENEANSEELKKPICENHVGEPIISQKSDENYEKSVEDLKGICGSAMQPLVLTRCKSEPARTGERPNREANFFETKRRLGAVEFEPYSQHNS